MKFEKLKLIFIHLFLSVSLSIIPSSWGQSDSGWNTYPNYSPPDYSTLPLTQRNEDKNSFTDSSKSVAVSDNHVGASDISITEQNPRTHNTGHSVYYYEMYPSAQANNYKQKVPHPRKICTYTETGMKCDARSSDSSFYYPQEASSNRIPQQDPGHYYRPSSDQREGTSYGVPEYGVGDTGPGYGVGTGGGLGSLGGFSGLLGLLGLGGLKGLKVLKPFIIGLILALPLAPLLIPLLLLLLLLPLLPLLLFLPIPVVVIPPAPVVIRRDFGDSTPFVTETSTLHYMIDWDRLNAKDISTKMLKLTKVLPELATDVLQGEECVERVSCEFARVSRSYNASRWVDKLTNVLPKKNRFAKMILHGFNPSTSSSEAVEILSAKNNSTSIPKSRIRKAHRKPLEVDGNCAIFVCKPGSIISKYIEKLR